MPTVLDRADAFAPLLGTLRGSSRQVLPTIAVTNGVEAGRAHGHIDSLDQALSAPLRDWSGVNLGRGRRESQTHRGLSGVDTPANLEQPRRSA